MNNEIFRTMSKLNNLSEQLLFAVKNENLFDFILDDLATFSLSEFEKNLCDDRHKNAFWINIYNAFFQILRKKKKLKHPKIYTVKEMTIAGRNLSLDDIEHGILRRYRYKYSLGFIPNFMINSQLKKWAVSKIDYRIHFALNCGAKSCPPIAFYSVDKLEEQLELSSLSFLETETQIDEKHKKVNISRLFLWFFNDFGGRKGTKTILSKYLKKDFSTFKTVFNPYSWDEQLDNYVENTFNQS